MIEMRVWRTIGCPGRKKYLERVYVCRVMYIHVYVCVQININISTAVRAPFIPEAHSICSQHYSCVVAQCC